jgi:S1-C subfamily serine protease
MRRALALASLVPALGTTPAAAQFSISAARRSTVWVITPHASGTGFLLDRRRGLFLTAGHVVDGTSTVRLVFPASQRGRLVRSRQWYRSRRGRLGLVGRVVRFSKTRDLALIRVAPPRIPPRARPVRLARAEPRPGNRLHLISGAPSTRRTAFEHVAGTVRRVDYRASRSAGVVRARREIHGMMRTRDGNSGAAVLSDRGELVGVHVALSHSTGLAVDVSVSNVRAFLRPPGRALARRR